MKIARKSMAMLLCLVMCFSFFPVSGAWAEEPAESGTEVEKKEETLVHEHTYTAEVTAPTCTEQGYTTYTCECGDTYVADYVEPQHQPVDVPEVPAATEAAGITAGKKCAICGEILEGCTETPKLESEPENDVAATDGHKHEYTAKVTAPTCTEEGYTTYTCVCGDSYMDDYVDATGHTPEDVAEVPATAESTGTTAGKKCTVCGEILEGCEEIPALEATGKNSSTKKAMKGNIASGTCGEHAVWSVSEEGVLTISGTGTITDYFSGTFTPWTSYNKDVVCAIVETGITSVPSYTFEFMVNLETVSLPNTLTALSCNAFNDCSKLREVTIPSSVITFNDIYNNFNRCDSLTDVYYLGTEEEFHNIQYYEACKTNDYQRVVTINYLSFHTGYEATCTEQGIQNYYQFDGTERYYSVDKQQLAGPPYITALGHDWDEGVVIREATPAQKGEKLFTCKRVSSHTKTEEFDYSGAGGTCGDNLNWFLDENGVLTISGTGAMEEYSVFDNPPWFQYREEIKSVLVEDGVTSIGRCAFYGAVGYVSSGVPLYQSCSNMTSVTLPGSLTSIGSHAFADCSALNSVTSPIWGYFKNCPVNTVTIPEGVTNIADEAFYGVSRLESIIIPEGITSIGRRAFSAAAI